MTKSSSGCRQGVMHCTVIINKSDYIKKVNNIIKEGMQQGKYMENMDSTQSDLKHFKVFFYSHFKKSNYDQMRPNSNQTGRLFTYVKTHKFTSLNNITVKNLKLLPIIDLTGTYAYNTSKS